MAQSLSPNERSAQDIPLLPVLDINTHIDMDEPTTLDHVDGLDHVDIQPVSPIQDSEDDTISHVEASNTAVRDSGQPSRGSEDSPEDRQKPDARALHTRYGGVSGLHRCLDAYCTHSIPCAGYTGRQSERSPWRSVCVRKCCLNCKCNHMILGNAFLTVPRLGHYFHLLLPRSLGRLSNKLLGICSNEA